MLLNRHMPRPILNGVEYLPQSGAFIIVANHYQRPGMWIGWVGALVVEAVNAIRPARTPLRIVVTDTQRMTVRGRERIVPLSGWFLKRVRALLGNDPDFGGTAGCVGTRCRAQIIAERFETGIACVIFSRRGKWKRGWTG